MARVLQQYNDLHIRNDKKFGSKHLRMNPNKTNTGKFI